eukprot:CAMPEP_0174699044 /NCGR_PEP_ID=MMETSP1094-20130205/4451_1 /TAXON_ID=156173 /ORGANISM="Chrysochromulina brevifilum, Strain UTEX LB 985" /LENGTH=101 /DNA_ID=CAMNT_0015896307 /DNA_START=295 /DNA_END=601 /DNA_ORIENTATION=-
MASYFGAICWHGPHHDAAKSTTTSCLDLAPATSLSNSALECTDCTEPARADPPRDEPRGRFLSWAPAGSLTGGGGGGGGMYGARLRGGFPGNMASAALGAM